MWYPLIEIGLNRGVWRAPNSMVSVTRRIEGRGGKIYSFCAMYSFRMSFWRVPETRSQATPCCRATARYMAHSAAAGELMVIETVTSPSGMPRKRISMSSSELTGAPHFPTSPRLMGWSASYPISVGRSKATESPV